MGFRRAGKCPSGLPAPHSTAIGDHILVVLFDGAGEAVMALGIGDEIVVVGLRWVHGSFEGAASGIGDRAGGQASVAIGVIGRSEAHIGMMQRTLVSSGQEFGVDDAGVGV